MIQTLHKGRDKQTYILTLSYIQNQWVGVLQNFNRAMDFDVYSGKTAIEVKKHLLRKIK